MKSICWTVLFLGILLPLTLRALKWIWVRISISGRFQPDFVGPIRTLLFGGIRENVNYSAPGENYWIVIIALFAIGFCSGIADLLFRLLPQVADLPDIMTGSVGILGFAITLFGFYGFLKENKSESNSKSEKPALSMRTVILLALVVIIVALLASFFISPYRA